MIAPAAVTEPLFLTAQPDSHEQLRVHALAVAEAVIGARRGERPFSGADPAALARAIAAIDPCPEEGVALAELLGQVRDDVLAHGVDVGDPRCAAHLHCPTLLSAAAAELAIGATNQSLDSFDQAPAATLVEDHLVRWLAGLLGLPAAASGVLTSGGTASNLLGLLLARGRACARVSGHRRRRRAAAAERALADRRLGRGARQRAPRRRGARARRRQRRRRGHRRRAARSIWPRSTRCSRRSAGRSSSRSRSSRRPARPTSARSTRSPALAERAAACGAWLHVDAAVGSAFALSPRLRGRLDGIERADSVTADLHKLWFMPIGASALLVRDVALLDAVHHHSDYLNRAEDEADGVLNLVGRSLDTSRRFDALKILVGLRSTGRRRLAAMVEGLVALTETAAGLVDAHGELELLADPSTVMVVFRWCGVVSPAVAAAPTAIAWTPSTSPPSARCCAADARSSGARGWTGASR